MANTMTTRNTMDLGDGDMTTPLLGGVRSQHRNTKPHHHQLSWATRLQARFGDGLIHSPKGVSSIICLAIFLWVLSGMVCLIPGLQIAETLFCKRYYGEHRPELNNDPEICKSEVVQSAMAYLFGTTALLDSIFNLITAFPFGVLADRGRRPIYMLGTAGQLLNIIWSLIVFYFDDIFPTELILVGPIFQIIGGGLGTATSILFAVISDVHKAEDRATWYFFFSLSAQAAIFCGPPFAALLMQHFSPWLPLMLSPVITVAAGMVILLIPETAQSADNQGTTTRISSQPSDHSGATQEDPINNDIYAQIQHKGWAPTAKHHIHHTLRTAKQTLLSSSSPSSSSSTTTTVPLLLLIFFFLSPLTQAFSQTFFQYTSTRYHISLAQAGYLLALRGGLTLFTMGILLPLTSHYLTTKIALPSFIKDLHLSRISALFTLLSLIGLSLPPLPFSSSIPPSPSRTLLLTSLLLSSLGAGLTPLCRSMLTHSTPTHRTAGMFSLVNIAETLGGLPSSMLMAWLFSVGMKLDHSPDTGSGDGSGNGEGHGGFWVGLPYMYLALCSAFAIMGLLFVRPPRPSHPSSRSSPRGTTAMGDGEVGEMGRDDAGLENDGPL